MNATESDRHWAHWIAAALLPAILAVLAILAGCNNGSGPVASNAPASSVSQQSSSDNPDTTAANLVTEPITYTASDGTALHAYLTSNNGDRAPRPLIVEFSPYGPTSFKASTGTFFGPGYNYLEVQDRGTGNNLGSWGALGPRDQKDVAEVLAWACKQPFSNGHIGLYGFSASAIAVYNAMHLKLDCVDAAALMAGSVDLYRDLLYPGGILNLVPAISVGFGVGTPLLADRLTSLLTGNLSLDVLQPLLGQLGLYTNILTHTTEDSYWRKRTLRPGPNTFPVLMDTSFYDPEPRGIYLAFKRLRDRGSHLLVFGAHDGFPKGTPGPFPQYKRWFDHYLLGKDNGITHEPKVQLLVGKGSFEALKKGKLLKVNGAHWPLATTKWQSLYLSPKRSGSAHSPNDGSFSTQAPESSTAQSYLFLPSVPTATDPHTSSVAGSLLTSLPFLTQLNSEALLSLTWTTPPLTQPATVVGPASLELYLSTLLPSADIYAVVADVWPDGTAHAVGVGRLRTDFPKIDPQRSLKDANGDIVRPYGIYSQRSPAPPGKVRKYYVEFWPIGNQFQAGHRIRLYLVGTSAFMLAAMPVNLSTAYSGGDTPSRLLLPVINGVRIPTSDAH